MKNSWSFMGIRVLGQAKRQSRATPQAKKEPERYVISVLKRKM